MCYTIRLDILIVLYYYVIKILKRFQKYKLITRGDLIMGTIVCQTCNTTIDHFEDEKVTVLYSKGNCTCDQNHPEEK